MTTYVYTAGSLPNQQVRLVTANRAQVPGYVLPLVASLVDNDSAVAGVTVKDALNTLSGAVTAVQAWDHVVHSLADLPPPAGGYHTLSGGSWAIAADVDVSPNTVLVPAATTVLIGGMSHFLSSSAVALEVEGTLDVDWLQCVSSAGAALQVNAAGTVRDVQSIWTSLSAQPACLSNGSLISTLSRFANTSTGSALQPSSGTTRLLGCNVTSTASAVSVGAASFYSNESHIYSSSAGSGAAVLVSGSGARVNLAGGTCGIGYAGGPAMRVNLAETFAARGVQIISTVPNTYGLRIAGDVDAVQVIGCDMTSEGTLVYRSIGSVVSAIVANNRTIGAAISNGIIWTAANLPSLGLLVVGNSFGASTGFSGFTAASARVNAKANIDSGGLMSETAIVP
jgi:hypothetical protein